VGWKASASESSKGIVAMEMLSLRTLKYHCSNFHVINYYKELQEYLAANGVHMRENEILHLSTW
jgi:hypothetical protein